MNERIEISLSQGKILLMTLGSFVFVLGGIWMFKESQSLWGIAAILFFGATSVVGIIKLIKSKKGLIIDSNGIIENTSATSVGPIEWNDILGFRTSNVASQKFILVDLKDPEKYIGKSKNKLLSQIMRKNLKMYGSPIAITANTLKFNFDKLEKLLETEFKKYKKTIHNN